MRSTNKKTFLLKWLHALVLCWSLGFTQVALAQRANAPSSPVVSPENQEISSADTTTSSTKEENKNVIKVEGNNVKAASKFLFSNLALFFTGLMTPYLIKACPKSPSVWVFGGSALLYIANEIGLFTGFNKAINEEMVAYLGRGDEDRQIESLESASKQTREAKKAAKRRAMIAKIAAVGFGAAAVTAALEAKGSFGMTSCAMAVGTPAVLYNEVEEIRPLPFQQNNYFNPLTSPYYTAQLEPLELANELESDTSYYDVKVRSSVEAKIVNYLVGNTYASDDENSGPVGTKHDAKIIEDKDTGEKSIAVNKVAYKVGALGLGGASFLAIKSLAPSLGTTFKNIAANPWYRAVGFGAFAGVAYGAATESEGAAENLEKRAKEYDRLADSLRNQTTQDLEIKTGAQTESTLGTTTDIGNGVNVTGSTTTCFTGGKGQLNVDKNCSCSSNNSCKKPEVPNIQALPEFGGQSLLADTMGDLRAAGSQLYSGKLSEGSAAANRVANAAARITRLRNNLNDKINKDRLSKGKKPIDFEKAEAGFRSKLEKDVERAFNNLSPTEQGTLANLAGGFGSSNSDKDEKEKEKDSPKKDGKTAIAATDVNPNAGSVGSDKNADGGTWDFNFDPEAEAAAEQAALAEALAAEEDENYVVKGDINDDRNKDIFNIITRRYLKSAYPVIFEEK